MGLFWGLNEAMHGSTKNSACTRELLSMCWYHVLGLMARLRPGPASFTGKNGGPSVARPASEPAWMFHQSGAAHSLFIPGNFCDSLLHRVESSDSLALKHFRPSASCFSPFWFLFPSYSLWAHLLPPLWTPPRFTKSSGLSSLRDFAPTLPSGGNDLLIAVWHSYAHFFPLVFLSIIIVCTSQDCSGNYLTEYMTEMIHRT